LCLFIVTLAYTSAQQLPPAPADGTCEAGKSYKQDCNTCVCGPNGKLGACTLLACPPRSKRSPATSLPPLPADGTCVAGNSYQKDCNTCRCTSENVAVCTEKGCISKRSADPQECSDGQTKQESCNTCRCASGQWACTRKICPGQNRKRRGLPPPPPATPISGSSIGSLSGSANRNRRAPEECSDGETKKEACNNCHCANGLWACTRKFCVDQKRNRRAPEECSDGQTKQESCNTCRCASGQWACTRKICPGQNRKRRDLPPKCTKTLCSSALPDLDRKRRAPEECSDGQTKQEECNTCHCANGLWACTKKFCVEENRKRRDTGPPAINPPCVKTFGCRTKDRHRRETQECKVGDFKMDNCNTCNCIQLGDGTKDWACTKLACPPNEPRARREAETCAAGDIKQEDCNTCKCTKLGDGKTAWACTRKHCPPRTRRDV